MPTSEQEIEMWLEIKRKKRYNDSELREALREERDYTQAEEIADAVIARFAQSSLPAGPQPPTPAPPQGRQDPAAATTNLPTPTSPYRFVRLNDVIIPALETVRRAQLDLPLADGFSGEISVDWVVETPLLIGQDSRVGDNTEVVPLTLGQANKFAIPGATIKGLLRASLETVTLGRLSQLNRDHRFGLRDFGDDHYRGDTNEQQSRLAWDKIGSGWLEKSEPSASDRAKGLSDYCITPCDKEIIFIRKLPMIWFPQPLRDAAHEGDRHLEWLQKGLKEKYKKTSICNEHQNLTLYDFSGRPAWFDSANGIATPALANHGREGFYVFSGPLPMSSTNQPEDRKKAIRKLNEEDLVTEGPKKKTGRKKKREYVFFDRPKAIPVRLPQRVFDAFELINSTPSGRGLQPAGSWKELRPTLLAGGRIPVFILGSLEADMFDFGLTRAFKVAHSQSVGDVLDKATNNIHRLRRDMLPDWAEAMFGNVLEEDDLLLPGENQPSRLPGEALPPANVARKGRVAVGFALATTPAQLYPQPPNQPIKTTMMGPRASFSPHYLVGPKKHWSDPGAELAGRKRYFPRFSDRDCEKARQMLLAEHTLPPANAALSTVSQLRFLVPAAGQTEIRFTGAIRVHNLLAEEVGALLWVLTHGGDIGGPLRHMIGRAKPFGAGQVWVEKIRLEKLNGHDDNADKLLSDPKPFDSFLKKFVEAMNQAVKTAGLTGTWQQQVQVKEWLGLSDPAWGQAQRTSDQANYPGAIRRGQPNPGIDMSKGPKAHKDLRDGLKDAGGAAPARWLSAPPRSARML